MTIVKIDHAGLTDLLPEGGFVAGKMYGIVMESLKQVNSFTSGIVKRIDVCDPPETNPLPIVFMSEIRPVFSADLSPAISKLVTINSHLQDQGQSISDFIIGVMQSYCDHTTDTLVFVIESLFHNLQLESEQAFHTELRAIREFGRHHSCITIVALGYSAEAHRLLGSGEPLNYLSGRGYYKNSRRADIEFDAMLLTQTTGKTAIAVMDKCRGVIFDKDKVVDVTELLC